MYEMLCPPRPSADHSTSPRKTTQTVPRRLRLSPDKPYEVEMARSGPVLLRAWSLMYRVYLEKGYADPDPRRLWYGLHDALPGTGTIVTFDGNDMVGTVSVIPDSPLGYPAETLYEDEVYDLKDAGRRPVEVGSLGVCPSRERDSSIVTNLFDLLSLYARDVRDATDLIITVNPRHEKFYKRMLLFERMGPEKFYNRVGKAPTVFMRLDLEKQRQVIRWEHDEGPLPLWHNGKHTMYRNFSSMKEEKRRIGWLNRESGPLDEDTVLRYFVEERPLVQEASLTAQYYLERCYPQIAWYAAAEAV